MNKIIRTFVIVFAVSLSFISTSCDEFDSIPLNIPVSFDFTATGNNPVYDSGTYCLDDSSSTYSKYADDIETLTYVEAAYRTKSSSSSTLSVTLNVRVINTNTQAAIIDFTLPNFKPSDYISAPLVLAFNQTQIQALNTYLADKNNRCFRAVITHGGMPAGQTVVGAVDIVFKADINL